jgi:EamA-like transporter family.
MWKLFGLVCLQSLFLAGSQVLLKIATVQIPVFTWTWSFFKAVLTNWWLLGSGITALVALVLWMNILKNYPFGIAYPLSCVGYVFGLLAAMLVFHEDVVWSQWVGILFILAGCALIAK